ncbi:hypothetical protein HMPREF9302_10610 [Prevotella amnii DNF00058]|uniref:Uncharacterized protein n=1 Tax=Prevotella amnii DNF00058 TaxID=1401066 RepID=A0A096ASH3_9BACT|nr:hypothetical protein HMPREF9302_10610 [Prevotella amnii DNF00058]
MTEQESLSLFSSRWLASIVSLRLSEPTSFWKGLISGIDIETFISAEAFAKSAPFLFGQMIKMFYSI